MTKLTREDVERIVEEARKEGERPDLRGADLSGLTLKGANFSEAYLSATNLRGTDLSRADLSKALLSGADLEGAILSRANLREANLSEAYLIGADLSRADLSGAYLIGAYLSGAYLGTANLSQAYLIRADLLRANLREVYLSEADLSGAVLIGADLSRANLSGANLTRANLSRASLTQVKLEDTDFLEALIGETIFVNVDLYGALNLETIQHQEPSMLDINTIYQSQDKIPKIFLEQAGVHPDIIRWQHSLHTRPMVFISYNHDDEKEKNQLLRHLDVLQNIDLIDIWHDEKIGAGDEWKKEIEQALARASVAILLISANFLTSDFINTQEIPALLQRRKNKEDLVIFPIIAKACAWQSVEWLAEMQVHPKGGQPIWGKDTDIDAELTKIADEVTEIVKNRWFSKKHKTTEIIGNQP